MGRFNLTKLEEGQRFQLSKNELDNIRVELTWQKGDLDAEAWLLDSDGRIINDEAFVFYNSENRSEPFDKTKFKNKKKYFKETRPMSADGAVLGSKDELRGGIETLNLILSEVDADVEEVVISATIHTPNADSVNVFGHVENAKITIIDEDADEPLCFFELSKDYQSEDAVVAARFIINEDGEWEFEAVGKGYNGGLQTLVEMYAE
ncbi:MAG: TerD family protein [Muribaculaceae bacterium]|nr:TerD family protein [Muribaculaceae bacterium]